MYVLSYLLLLILCSHRLHLVSFVTLVTEPDESLAASRLTHSPPVRNLVCL